jgi:hypothetical protein
VAIALLELPPSRASRVAYLTAALNLAAALLMLSTLKPGLPVSGSLPADRIAFIERNKGLWWAGWLVWHAAAISLVLFFLVLAGRFRGRAPVLCAAAVVVSVVGLAADLSAEAIYMGVVPELRGNEFHAAEIVGGILTGYLGNGLYTVAGILLTWSGARELPRSLLGLALPTWGAGLCLSASSLLHSADGQLWSTAVLMPLFVLWAALVGWWLSHRAS